MLRLFAQAAANLLIVLLMAVLTIPAIGLIWLASIPMGYLKKQLPSHVTKEQVETLRERARRHTGEHYAGGL